VPHDVAGGVGEPAVDLAAQLDVGAQPRAQADEAVARETAGILASLGLPSKEGNSSIFAGSSFEIMKTPFRGTHGHLAIKCFNVERALAFLARLGYSPVEETAKTEKGHLKTIYLDKEIGGFAVHLLRD